MGMLNVSVPLQRQALDTHQQVAEELEVFEAEIQQQRRAQVFCVTPDAAAYNSERPWHGLVVLPKRGLALENDIIHIRKLYEGPLSGKGAQRTFKTDGSVIGFKNRTGKLPTRMYNGDHFNACGRDAIKNQIIWVRHDFARAGYSQTWLEQVGMLGRVLQVLLNSLKKLLSCLSIAFANVGQNVQQIGLRRGLPLNRQHEENYFGPVAPGPRQSPDRAECLHVDPQGWRRTYP